MGALGGLYLIGALALFVLALVWLLLPLAIVGIKPRLDRLIAQNQRLIELLETRPVAPRPGPNCPACGAAMGDADKHCLICGHSRD